MRVKLAQMLAVLILAGAAGADVLAQPNRPTDMPAATSAAAAASATASGEVLAVYKKQKRLLLKHGPIENLGMGGMTMEFGVAQDKLLGALKKGDKVRFEAKKMGDDYVVTRIEVVK
jgi:Cu(I)/Ag(I) efflux system periplasmic protein CusF